MRLGANAPRLKGGLWGTTLIFLLCVLGGYTLLEERGFLPVLLLVGLSHLLLSASYGSRCSLQFLVAQNLVALGSVGGVVLHVLHLVEPVAAPMGVLGSFTLASWTTGSFYPHFGSYVLVFLLATGALYWVVRRFGSSWEGTGYLPVLYSASTVNIAIDYAVRQPLYRFQGSPEDPAFLLAVGVFGAEFSILLYLLCLVAYGAGCRRQSRR